MQVIELLSQFTGNISIYINGNPMNIVSAILRNPFLYPQLSMEVISHNWISETSVDIEAKF